MIEACEIQIGETFQWQNELFLRVHNDCDDICGNIQTVVIAGLKSGTNIWGYYINPRQCRFNMYAMVKKVEHKVE